MRLATLQADFGRWLKAECPEAAARLGGGPGLDIYLNNYRSQLIAALESGFPQLRRWLGEAAFLAAAAQHIEAVPPCDWTLDAYGADFASTVSALDPDDAVGPDLASIEWALAQAFVAEDAEPVVIETLGALDWDAALIRFVPSFRLLPVTSNAATLWQALADESMPPPGEQWPKALPVLVWRHGFQPHFRVATPEEAGAIERLHDGMRFGALCTELGEAHGAEQGAALAGAWLGGWLREGLVTDVA
jgi:hypothetical protein